ncbi:hypothetical protein [Cacatuid alphaherpesvirus 2]|uniref:Uncharacterized protein n=1 Tax=Cacatuid alphaherpesvirus 2 TaxID=2604840 RepID=A0A5B9R4R5_9ALPH|nr:hypothetical protein QKT46_gp16 [Cacatuid alphaherpesvirus 2]QEG54080.1 hypothetical protein [Cacatuid alphaherpesvirus 2]
MNMSSVSRRSSLRASPLPRRSRTSISTGGRTLSSLPSRTSCAQCIVRRNASFSGVSSPPSSWFGHRMDRAEEVFDLHGATAAWLASSVPFNVSIHLWDHRDSYQLLYGYALRRGKTGNLPMIWAGAPDDGGLERVLLRPAPDGREVDVHVDPITCLDFSMTAIAPGKERFWPVVPPKDFLNMICSQATDLVDSLLSERVVSKTVITPMVLFPENTFLPGYWDQPLVSGRYMPVFSPTAAEQAYARSRNLQYPFTIDLERKRNNFWVGLAVGIMPDADMTERERRLTKVCVHNILSDVISKLERVTIFPVTISSGSNALMGVTSDERGLRVYVKEVHSIALPSQRRKRRRANSAIRPIQSMLL